MAIMTLYRIPFAGFRLYTYNYTWATSIVRRLCKLENSLYEHSAE